MLYAYNLPSLYISQAKGEFLVVRPVFRSFFYLIVWEYATFFPIRLSPPPVPLLHPTATDQGTLQPLSESRRLLGYPGRVLRASRLNPRSLISVLRTKRPFGKGGRDGARERRLGVDG